MIAHRPRLTSSDPLLTRLHDDALSTVERNISSAAGPPVLCAGADYPTPWTRDAAINCWSAVSLLDPALAESTLRAVCEPTADGEIIAQDDQWWDQVVWIQGAYRHVQITGDREFGRWAGGVADRSLRILRSRFRPARGLYAGGAMMQDGISGYPFPALDLASDSSFVLDHPESHEVHALSTNVLYVVGHEAAAALAQTGEGRRSHLGRADDLRAAIRRHFAVDGGWAYLLRPDGSVDTSQELLGLALAVEHRILDDAEVDAVVDGLVREPHGPALVTPHFPRYSDARPGRHNVMLWPMASGQWAVAAALRGRHDELVRTLDELTSRVTFSDGTFYEVYDARTGEVSGGWQVGRWWQSVANQTWSATAYLRCLYEGLLGMRFGNGDLTLVPHLPIGVDEIELTGLRWRGRDLTVRLRGEGSQVTGVTVNGAPLTSREPIRVPDATGPCAIDVLLGTSA